MQALVEALALPLRLAAHEMPEHHRNIEPVALCPRSTIAALNLVVSLGHTLLSISR